MTVRTAAARRANGRAPNLPPADAAAGAVIPVRLDRIRPSPLNPRKHFDDDSLRELADSIRSVGLLEPVIVRPAPGVELVKLATGGRPRQAWKDPHDPRGEEWPEQPLELVAGERRFRAAKLAGLSHIDAKVLELTDKQVLEIAVVENEQRADTRASEKARGYGELIDRHGYTVETLAARVGKSATTVRDLLRLRDLPSRAAAALDAGELSPSVAQLVARLPTPAMRLAGERYALTEDRHDGLPTYRMFRAWQESECQVELKGCPFRQDDESLVEGAGSCELCPKRAGNLQRADPAAWKGARADVCTDPACYREKVLAHAKRVAAEAEGEGLKVLTPQESAKLYPYSTAMAYDSPYLDLAAKDNSDPKKRNYKQLVGEELAAEVVLAFDRAGHPHRLVAKAKAEPILRAKLPGRPPQFGPGGMMSRSREEKERELGARDRKAAGMAANGAVAEAMRRAAPAGTDWPPMLAGHLRRVAIALAEITWTDACRRVGVRRGLPKGHDHKDAVRALARTLDSVPELLTLIAELVAAKTSLDWSSLYYDRPAADQLAWWKEWGVDYAALVGAAKRERKAKKAHEPEGD